MKVQIFFVTLLAIALINLSTACSGTKTAQGTAKADIQTCQVQTSAQCGMCQTRIEEALMKVKGVKTAQLDLQSNLVAVKYDATQTSPDNLRKAIAAAGYDADKVAANPAAYEKLPACCKKGGHE